MDGKWRDVDCEECIRNNTGCKICKSKWVQRSIRERLGLKQKQCNDLKCQFYRSSILYKSKPLPLTLPGEWWNGLPVEGRN